MISSNVHVEMGAHPKVKCPENRGNNQKIELVRRSKWERCNMVNSRVQSRSLAASYCNNIFPLTKFCCDWTKKECRLSKWNTATLKQSKKICIVMSNELLSEKMVKIEWYFYPIWYFWTLFLYIIQWSNVFISILDNRH